MYKLLCAILVISFLSLSAGDIKIDDIKARTTQPEPEVALYFPENPRIPVLAYHSVMPERFYYPTNVNNPWILHADTFYQQMRYLYENNFTPLTSEMLINFLFYDGGLPTNPIIITFDDGYLDNALFAAPILREFGFTAMQFLITSYIPEQPQRMRAWPTPFMSHAEIYDTMDVFEFGSHTHDMHRNANGAPLLTTSSVANIRADILQSFEYPLTMLTGFAYPFGRHSTNAMRALQDVGILFAFTTQEAYLTRTTNPMLIPRFQVTGGPHGWCMEHFSDVVWSRR